MLSALQREDSYKPSTDNVLKSIALSLQAAVMQIDDLVLVTFMMVVLFIYFFYFLIRATVSTVIV